MSFAFIKATEGVDRVDAKLKQNYTQANKAGINIIPIRVATIIPKNTTTPIDI